MKLTLKTTSPLKEKTPVLILPIFEETKIKDMTGVDDALKGEVINLFKSNQLSGKPKAIFKLQTLGAMGASTLVFAGLGKKEESTLDTIRHTVANAARAALSGSISEISLHIPKFLSEPIFKSRYCFDVKEMFRYETNAGESHV